MTWIRDNNLTWLQRLAVNVIKAGPIPNHVAFIMDGNRRFASKSNIKKSEGHAMGFDKLSEVLQWCNSIGINQVTVYAFSIENFKRSSEEVDTLMSLAREKFARLLEERDKLNERGVCIKIIGNISLLPDDIQQTIADAMLLTKDNKKALLNVAFAYTSRDEIVHAIKTVVEGVENNDLIPADITEDILSKCLYNKGSEPDLLVRTSGETRLSDFLLWQTSSTIMYFTQTLWPEFTLWHLLAVIFYYQRCFVRMSLVKNTLNSFQESINDSTKINKFFDKVERANHKNLLKISGKNY